MFTRMTGSSSPRATRQRSGVGLRSSLTIGSFWPRGVTRTLHGLGRRDPDRPDIYVGTVQDVTELRQVERQLRRERDYGAVITSSMHEGFMLTRDGAILEVNQALCELTGFTREELVGAHAPYPFWAPESAEEISRQRALIGERGHDFEATVHAQGRNAI